MYSLNDISMTSVKCILFFLAIFDFVLSESYPYHNAILFVNEFSTRGVGSVYTAISPGGVTTNSRYTEAIEYWNSIIAKSTVPSTLVDACYDRACQRVTVQEIAGRFLDIEVTTRIFPGNVTGYTVSQLMDPSILRLRYQPTTITGRFKHVIKGWTSKVFQLFSHSGRDSWRIDNILLGQYPGWTTFVTRIKHHISYRDVLAMEHISCIVRSAIESPKNFHKTGFCVHVVGTHGSKLDIRLFKDSSANFADPWGLPCSEVDNPSEFELDCLH
ncbi:hypothetical protein C6P45_003350 [Maudiozyma exigua]|uniref:Uncharacterized protein n=1 Tax=Maudiozyma exigua TaxID=34358 RepID=A0A9P6VUY4_MAUEX|nr:hypothetical protein C6P45_003350 [Kazachstania exigua]